MRFHRSALTGRLRVLGRSLILGLMAALSLGVLPARSETLNDVLTDAYAGNADIQAQRFTLRQTDEQLPQALSGWRPTVQLQASAIRTHQYFGFLPPPTQTFNDTRAALQITQPLWRGGGTVADTERAKAVISAGRYDLSAVEQSRLLAAAKAFLDVFRDQGVVKLNENLEQVLSVNRDNVQATFNAGAATETDVAQANARLSGAVASRLAAQSNLASSAAAFATAVGRPPKQLVVPAAMGSLPDTEEAAVSTAIANNPTIFAAKARIEAAQHQVDVLRGTLLPRIDAVGSLDHENGVFAKRNQLNDERFGIQASMPLYEAGNTYSQIRAAREAIGVAEKQMLQAERQVRQDVAAGWTALAAARSQQQSFRDQIRANQVALADTQKEVTVGTRTRLDTLNAEQELFSSQVNLVSAEHDTLLATFQLEQAMGLFSPQALGLSVKSYNPDTHLEAVRGKWLGTDPPE